ncbi:NADP-dependent isocitrate dehydrogenase [Bradyrhizobium sp. WSM 1738]|uniref:NADP-dependent isocitrate dehydrogenase n=1 Tax=Bradyrhizobium hereditatis TaxID=2821405 RepID=UPI001CE3116F|nr:NADP-dependent isocitrate dehydrogenase [Bradyrhizobium hereditatis]MCA6115252.1 NADP-dependent isocitrate dehydrogenase [Bradyrhizobium hereditatis]
MKVIYCKTDESPLVAWYSLSPIIKVFSREVDLEIEEMDVSLCGLILSEFGYRGARSENSCSLQAVLGRIVSNPGSVVIKPPCISANAVQLRAAVKELQEVGFPLEDYCRPSPNTEASLTKARYDRLLGSVINKLLRQGTMVRQLESARPARATAQETSVVLPALASSCQVASMKSGDFRSTEHSIFAVQQQSLRIEFLCDSGEVSILKDCVELEDGDVASFSVMQQSDLRHFLYNALEDAKNRSLVFSLQLKCNALKADEQIFAEAVKAYYRRVYEHFGEELESRDVNPGLGLCAVADAANHIADADVFKKLIYSAGLEGPWLAVNPGEAVSHLHARNGPSIARAMADAIVSGGRVSATEGIAGAAKFVIPDSSYSGFYDALIDDFKTFGLLRPDQVQHIAIVGLTRDSAEEYGAQETTFGITGAGNVRVVDGRGAILSQHRIECGGIWRMITASASAVADWIEMTMRKAREMRCPAVFWLDRNRPHHREIIKKVEAFLSLDRSERRDVRIMEIRDATRFVLQQLRSGQSVIAAVGNVLRDYLSELLFALAGTNKHAVQSYSRLSRGGCLFEVGTGGTAPRIFQEFLRQNFLRWNPIADGWAFVGAYRHIARERRDQSVEMLAAGLEHSMRVIRQSVAEDAECAPMDTRVIHFFLAKNWANWLSIHLNGKGRFSQIGNELRKRQGQILRELACSVGKPVELGGYYFLNEAAVFQAMRPSTSFNTALTG